VSQRICSAARATNRTRRNTRTVILRESGNPLAAEHETVCECVDGNSGRFQSRMRLIKFAGSLVEVQRQAFVCGSHRVVGLQLLLCVHSCGNPSPAGVPWGTLFTHSTVWKSVRLQIRCSETNVITFTSTCRFLPSVSSHPELVCPAGGREGPHQLIPLWLPCLPAWFTGFWERCIGYRPSCADTLSSRLESFIILVCLSLCFFCLASEKV